MQAKRGHFLPLVAACCPLMTFFTILASSTKKARMMLSTGG